MCFLEGLSLCFYLVGLFFYELFVGFGNWGGFEVLEGVFLGFYFFLLYVTGLFLFFLGVRESWRLLFVWFVILGFCVVFILVVGFFRVLVF